MPAVEYEPGKGERPPAVLKKEKGKKEKEHSWSTALSPPMVVVMAAAMD